MLINKFASYIMGALIIGSLSMPVFAAPGDLDVTFDGDGKVTTTFGSNTEHATAMAIQSDGKIVSVGWMINFGNSGGTTDIAIARYLPNGNLDTTFGTGGKVISNYMGSIFNLPVAVQLQTDGKIVLAANFAPDAATGLPLQFGLARYNANGSLDATFGSGGFVAVNAATGNGNLAGAGGNSINISDLVILPDGKFVLTGGYYNTSATEANRDGIALVRFRANGTLDPAFGTGGRVYTNFGDSERANAIVLRSDGRLTVAGTVFNTTTSVYEFAVVRYLSGGTRDFSFGSSGVVHTPMGATPTGGYSEAHSLAIQSDNKTVVAGGNGESFALARYNANGSLDTGFGTGGKAFASFSAIGTSGASAVAIGTGGRIVAVGVMDDFTTVKHALARFNTNGSLDATFGAGGKVTTTFGPVLTSSGFEGTADVKIQADGKIVTVGRTANGVDGDDFTAARYLP